LVGEKKRKKIFWPSQGKKKEEKKKIVALGEKVCPHEWENTSVLLRDEGKGESTFRKKEVWEIAKALK